jgi:hypothetical protein
MSTLKSLIFDFSKIMFNVYNYHRKIYISKFNQSWVADSRHYNPAQDQKGVPCLLGEDDGAYHGGRLLKKS